jgi:hypothetical protein
MIKLWKNVKYKKLIFFDLKKYGKRIENAHRNFTPLFVVLFGVEQWDFQDF